MPSRRAFLGQAAAFAAMPQSDKRIRLAVVGGGFGATFHFHEHPNCTVTAVTDLYPERRTKLRDHYKCDNVYNSLDDLLAKRRDLDAIAIFSGAPDHVKQVKLCMERGLHVCCAVPAAMSLEEADQLRTVKEKTGLRYMMAESSYYRQAAIHARNLYKQGAFGTITYSEVEYYHDFNIEDRLNKKPSLWFHPDGSHSWRQGLPPMHYPTHSLGFVVGVKAPMQHWALAVDRVRYSGEPVAVVIAEDRYQAEDALDAIRVEYRPLRATVDIAEASEAGAPLLHEAVGSNVVNERHFRYGDPQQAFANAARRVALTLGRSLALALLCRHAQWSLQHERDGRARTAGFDGRTTGAWVSSNVLALQRERAL